MPFGFNLFGRRKSGDEESGSLDSGVASYEAGLKCQLDGDYVRAVEHYARAEKVFLRLSDTPRLIMCLNNLGSVATNLEEFKIGLAALQDAERLCRETGNMEELAKVRNNQGVLHLRRGDSAAAMSGFEEKAKICRSIGDMRGVGSALANQAAVLCELNEIAKAAPLLAEAVQICRQYEAWRGLGSALRNQANIALQSGEKEKAAGLIEDALSAFEKANDRPSAADCREILNEIGR